MNFTIASVDDISREVHYGIVQDGNKYLVVAHSDKNGRNVSRRFDELTEAYKVFEKIVSWIAFGLYADNDRMDFIEKGTMR